MSDSNPLVFISYARRDGCDHAERLDVTLPDHGFRTWRDIRGIDPAKDFTAEIEQAIDASQYVVACITPDVRRGDSFVRREIQYALMSAKPVIVARFEDVKPPIHVIDNSFVDFFGRAWDDASADLVTQLRKTPAALPSTEPPPDAFRAYVQWLYQRMTRFLEQAVIRLIDIDVVDDPDQVTPPPRRVQPRDIIDQRYLPYDPSEVPPLPAGEVRRGSGAESPEFTTFQQAFEYYGGRVLLLGDPGAGKSVTLMAHARDAAAARLDDPRAPLPIFAIIPTWDAEHQTPLAEWLAEGHDDLHTDGLQRVLDDGGALLLLDGLDELGGNPLPGDDAAADERTDPRARFLVQIPANNHVVVSCRIEDYAQIAEKAPLAGAVTLQPLTDAQIRAYLADDPDLLAAVEADNDLKQLVRMPLIMSLFAFAYRAQGGEAAQLRDLHQSPTALRKMIFGRYVRARYEWEARRSPDLLPFTLDEIYEVLGYVAAENILWEWRSENVLFRSDFVAGLALLGDKSADDLIALAVTLNLLRVDGADRLRFTHLLLRLYFASVDRLIAALCDENEGINHARVAKALGQIGDARAVEPLIVALRDGNMSACISVTKALGQLGDVRAVEPLLAVLCYLPLQVRNSAVEALGQVGEPAIEPLIAMLRDADEWGRCNAAYALGQLGDARVVEPLITALRDAHKGVRLGASEALGYIGDTRAVEPLIAALRDDADRDVRARAAYALGYIGDTRAVEPLIDALQDDEGRFRLMKRVCDFAAEALEQIGTPEALDAVRKWREERRRR